MALLGNIVQLSREIINEFNDFEFKGGWGKNNLCCTINYYAKFDMNERY